MDRFVQCGMPVAGYVAKHGDDLAAAYAATTTALGPFIGKGYHCRFDVRNLRLLDRRSKREALTHRSCG